MTVAPVDSDKLSIGIEPKCDIWSSEKIRQRVNVSREIQCERYKNLSFSTSSDLSNKLMSNYCTLSPKIEILLKRAVEKFHLSTRAYFKLIKLLKQLLI